MNILALPACSDNYIWLLHNNQQAIVIDPGEAAPVISALQQYKLQLAAILITHHHTDHVGGVNELRPYLPSYSQSSQAFPTHSASITSQSTPHNANIAPIPVWGPATEAIPQPFTPTQEGDKLHLLGLDIHVLNTYGHTAGHIAYYIPSFPSPSTPAPLVFTGDTLFSAGCGRLFEGTAAQMYDSLKKLAALPLQTRVYCAHEYTISNLKFAQTVEPQNTAITQHLKQCQKLRAENLSTLPSTIAQELAINPFLRTEKSTIINTVCQHNPNITKDPESIFAALRTWKDHF